MQTLFLFECLCVLDTPLFSLSMPTLDQSSSLQFTLSSGDSRRLLLCMSSRGTRCFLVFLEVQHGIGVLCQEAREAELSAFEQSLQGSEARCEGS